MTGFKSRTTFYKYVVKVVALSRQDGSIVWTAQLPAGANATLAVVGNTLLAGAGFPLTTTQHPVVVAYRLGA